MIGSIRRLMDSFRGDGDYALSIPSLDGAFRPNDILEAAAVLLAAPRPDNLAFVDEVLHFSSEGNLLRLKTDGTAEVVDRGAPVTALAAAADGRLAVARSGGPVTISARDGSRVEWTRPAGAGDVTAMSFVPDGSLVLAIGAAGRKASDWRQDFMIRGRTGSVWSMARNGSMRELARGLAYPYGIVPDGKGGLVVSTAWDAALVCLDGNGRPRTVLTNLPGYPARIVPAEDVGYWLAVFAPRNQLVEFVLREKPFRKRMMSEIEPEYWVCPALAPASSPLEVMQDGAQKIGGSIKPWAPTLSYGMVVKLDRDFQPERSFHSRSNGSRHGITSVAANRGAVFASSAGANAIVRVMAE